MTETDPLQERIELAAAERIDDAFRVEVVNDATGERHSRSLYADELEEVAALAVDAVLAVLKEERPRTEIGDAYMLALNARVARKDEEIESLRAELVRVTEERDALRRAAVNLLHVANGDEEQRAWGTALSLLAKAALGHAEAAFFADTEERSDG